MTLKIFAASLSALFEQAAHDFFEFLLDLETVGTALREKVVVEADTLPKLLQAWLERLNSFVQTEKMVFNTVTILAVEQTSQGTWRLEAYLVGELIDSQRHIFRKKSEKQNIEACQLEQSKDGYQAMVVFSPNGCP